MSYKKYTVLHHTCTAPGSGKFLTGYHLVLDYHLGRVQLHTHHDSEANITVEEENHPVLYAVALVGNYDKYDIPSPLLNALIHVLSLKIQRKEIPAQIYTHCGIHKTMKTTHTTQCPGQFLSARLPEIRAGILQQLSVQAKSSS